MSKEIEYGKVRVTTEQNFIAGAVSAPVRRYYEERVRVSDQKEEFEEYLKFSDELKNRPYMVDPAWRIEFGPKNRTDGYYYCVKCWTELDYQN